MGISLTWSLFREIYRMFPCVANLEGFVNTTLLKLKIGQSSF